jgi:plasmid stabilization system protein ParE
VRVELHPDARTELRSAALWYEERRIGLGDELVAEISATLDRIASAPESFPRWPGTGERSPLIHRSTVHRFPYVIGFEMHEDHCLVLAIAHSKRRPLYWLTRAAQ